MKNNVIIIAIIIIAVIVIGAAAFLMTSPTADNMTQITANGSKVTVINNNQDVWAHWNLEVQNLPLKNGTQQTYHVQLWLKPGENATFDLSNMAGYGEETLPQDTNITVLGYGGLYNQTANGQGDFNTTFLGWTTNQTIPDPTSVYKSAVNSYEVNSTSLVIGTLPENITDTMVIIETTNNMGSNDRLFQQFCIIIDENGVPHFNPCSVPTLCEVMAQL